ncbi:MAG: hypothetical protein AABN33_02155 [Acidobacteriota bacterium]
MTGKKTIHIEAEGFCDGTQGVSSDNRLVEIDGHFAKERQTVRHSAARPQKRLEALIDTLKARVADAEKLWRKLEALTDGVPPQIALPLLAVLSAAAVVPAEAVFVAPVLDGLGVSDPVEQLVFAGVLVLASSGLLKIAIHQLRNLQHHSVGRPTVREETTQRDAETNATAARPLSEPGASSFARGFKIATSTLMILFAVSLVSFLGWWRAEELIFAGSVGGDELGEFLGENPTLTRVVITLLTIGLPVFAAIAFEHGFDSLHAAWQWRKARRAHRRHAKALNDAQKQLEARDAEVEHQVAALDEQRKEWRGSYLHNHELGTIVGAHRRPLRQVVLKIAAVAVLIFAIWLLLDPLVSAYIESPVNRAMLAVLLTFSLGGLYAARAIKSWDRPSPEELYKHRRVIWRNETGEQKRPPIPPEQLNSSGNGAQAGAPLKATTAVPSWTVKQTAERQRSGLTTQYS